MMLVRLAMRNIMRNARRSLVTCAAMAFGLATLIFLWAFADGTNEQMIDNSTRYLSGHLQVHRSGYHEERTLDLLLSDPGRIEALLESEPHTRAVSRRFEGKAIVSAGDKSRGMIVSGIDPDRERAVTTLSDAVRVGRFLRPDDRDGLLLGALAAQALKVGVGDELVLLTQAADGSVGAGRFRVQGIFDTGMDMIDGVNVFLPLAAAQDLYAAGDRVTSVVARFGPRKASGPVAARLRQALGPGHEVLTWRELLPAVVQSVAFHEMTGYILLLVLFVVVAVGVTNTMLMAVMERTREFGVMMALGTSEWQVTRVVFYEACLLGAAGLAAGGMLGMAIAGYYGARGIDLGHYAQAVETMPGLTSMIYPVARPQRVLLLSGLVFVTALLAAVYPGWRATRLRPVDAIRGLRQAAGRWRPHGSGAVHPSLPLPLFWKIACRGIVRNPRRTLLTVAATSFGLAAFVFLLSFVSGYLRQITDNSTGYLTGALQVQDPDFRKEASATLRLRGGPALLASVRADPLVAAAAPRVQVQALASTAAQSENIMLLGIEPASEYRVTFVHRAIVDGAALREGQDREIVLGRKLAAKLDARLGEKIVVMAQAADGSIGSAAYKVSAIFVTESEPFDAGIAFVSLRSAQAMLAMGPDISTVAVALRDRERLAEAAASLRQRLRTTPYAVVTWQELLPEVAQMIDYVRSMVRVVVAIVFGVAAMGVMNTLVMSVMERTRELGVMMALGTSPGAVVRLVLYESAVLAVAGLLAGLALGALVVAYFGSTGIDMSRYTRAVQTIPGLAGMIYPRLSGAQLWVPVSALFLISVAAALYPAWRAARLDPVPAIRHG